MKKVRDLLLIILFICPFIVKADARPLEFSYDRLAKLGGEVRYEIYENSSSYEFYIEYDPQYLKFYDYYRIYYDLGSCGDLTVKDNNGKITVKMENGNCSGIVLNFKTLKEGTTTPVIKGEAYLGAPFKTPIEIIDTNKKCEKCPEVKECEKCEKCPEVKECEKCTAVNESSNSSSNNIVLYVVLGVLVILNIVTLIFTLRSNKLNKKSTE